MRGVIALATVAVIAIVGLLAPAPGRSQSETLLDSLVVQADNTGATSNVTLQAGVSYRIVSTGYVTEKYQVSGSQYEDDTDAIYCFAHRGGGATSCDASTSSATGLLRLSVGNTSTTGNGDFGAQGGTTSAQAPLPPYDSGHRYEGTIVAPRTGKLTAFRRRNTFESTVTYTGGYRVDIYGPPASTPPPQQEECYSYAASASKRASSGARASQTVEDACEILGLTPRSRAPRNGELTSYYGPTELGTAVTLLGLIPRPRYAGATVEVGMSRSNGLRIDQAPVVAITNANAEKAVLVCGILLLAGTDGEDQFERAQNRRERFATCAAVVARILQRAKSKGATSSTAKAAKASRCRAGQFRLKGARRASRVRISCTRTRVGMRITIRPRSRGRTLRSVIGKSPRLIVGRPLTGPAPQPGDRVNVLWTATGPGSRASFTGRWTTKYGTIDFRQRGNRVRGTSDYKEGQLSGKVRGRTLRGTWTQLPDRKPPANAGDFAFTMNAKGTAFTGRWRYGSSGAFRTDWRGRRQ